MYLMCGPRQLFFQCGPEMPKGWTPLRGLLSFILKYKDHLRGQACHSSTFSEYVFFIFFKILFIYFVVRGKGREKVRKRNIRNVLEVHQLVVSLSPPTGEPGPQPRRVPRQGLKRQPFGSQAGAQSTEPHQPGLVSILSNTSNT